MKNLIALLVVATAMFALTGCKDRSPEGVCKHYMELAEEDDADELKECSEELGEMKKELDDDDKWNKFADCILDAEDKKAAKKCEP